MVALSGAELLGGEASGEVCAEFVRAWHGSLGEGGLVAVTPLGARTGAATESRFARCERLAVGAEMFGLDEWIWQEGRTGPHNLYHSVGILKARPRKGRGKKDDIERLPGLWMDLDVGDSKFSSEADCWEALRGVAGVGLCPSIIVGSGSGGLHGYWLVDGGVEGALGEQLNQRLRMLLMQQVGGSVAVDNVSSREHIMRLPGSLRWPKRTESGSLPTECKIAWKDLSRRVDVSWLAELTDGMWEREQAAFRERRESFRMEEAEAACALMSSTTDWGRLYRIAFFEQIFAERWTWEEVLEPHGWTLVTDWSGLANGAPDSEGRRTWTRPGTAGVGKSGVNARSLQTDWEGNPHVATLKSRHPDTGLMRLVDAAVPLSKFRVWLELSGEWHGDLVGYMRGVAAGTATELW